MNETAIALLNFLSQRQEDGRPPSYPEMLEAIGKSSYATVSYHLANLEEDGYIERMGGHRDVRVLRMPDPEPEPEA